jgi:hypothetical protein
MFRKYINRRKDARIHTQKATEFVFCKRRFGAVMLDTSASGIKLSCDIQLGVGSIIHLPHRSVFGKIVWRDAKKNSMGIKFIKDAPARNDLPLFVGGE